MYFIHIIEYQKYFMGDTVFKVINSIEANS